MRTVLHGASSAGNSCAASVAALGARPARSTRLHSQVRPLRGWSGARKSPARGGRRRSRVEKAARAAGLAGGLRVAELFVHEALQVMQLGIAAVGRERAAAVGEDRFEPAAFGGAGRAADGESAVQRVRPGRRRPAVATGATLLAVERSAERMRKAAKRDGRLRRPPTTSQPSSARRCCSRRTRRSPAAARSTSAHGGTGRGPSSRRQRQAAGSARFRKRNVDQLPQRLGAPRPGCGRHGSKCGLGGARRRAAERPVAVGTTLGGCEQSRDGCRCRGLRTSQLAGRGIRSREQNRQAVGLFAARAGRRSRCAACGSPAAARRDQGGSTAFAQASKLAGSRKK
jgi:hypothetical protein